MPAFFLLCTGLRGYPFTFDGLAIVYAVAEYLASGPMRPRAILAAHYHELSTLATQLPQISAWRLAIEESATGVRFLYKLEPGGADRSFGIVVARMAGLPPAIIQRAEALIPALEPVTQENQPVLRRLLGAPH